MDFLANRNVNPLNSLDLIVQELPPVPDAIGEYTAFLAAAVGRKCSTRILTNSDHHSEDVRDVEIVKCFTLRGIKRLAGLLHCLTSTKAQAIVLQYNPFAWGRRGWALDLAAVMRKVRTRRPDLAIGTMFHELYPPSTEFRFRLMRLWQIPQYRVISANSDICFFSTGVWANDEKQRRPHSLSVHLPVGANLPEIHTDRRTSRSRFGIDQDALVLGVFGGAHVSKQLDWVRDAIHAVASLGLSRPLIVLHVGGEKEAVRKQLTGTPLIQTGRLSSSDAATAIGAMDILLNPFLDGMSTRRGSTIAALQNGVAVVSTSGFNTESLWSSPSASGVVLTPQGDLRLWIDAVCALASDSERQEAAGKANRKLFEARFDWNIISAEMLTQLARVRDKKRLYGQ